MTTQETARLEALKSQYRANCIEGRDSYDGFTSTEISDLNHFFMFGGMEDADMDEFYSISN